MLWPCLKSFPDPSSCQASVQLQHIPARKADLTAEHVKSDQIAATKWVPCGVTQRSTSSHLFREPAEGPKRSEGGETGRNK